MPSTGGVAGASGDGATGYSLEREVEDIMALIDSIGGQVDLVGHSYGAICALEVVARHTTHVRRLVLYEPPIPVGSPAIPAGVIDRIETLVREGNREEAGTVFALEVAKIPPDMLEFLR